MFVSGRLWVYVWVWRCMGVCVGMAGGVEMCFGAVGGCGCVGSTVGVGSVGGCECGGKGM